MEERKLNMNIRLHHSPNESWKTTMEILDLDKLRIEGISKGRDFIISEPQTVKKDLKSDSSIFSSKYGASIVANVAIILVDYITTKSALTVILRSNM